MGDKLDTMKGRVKEATGSLTGDDELRREGRLDQFSGDVKRTTDDVADKVKDGTERVRRRMQD